MKKKITKKPAKKKITAKKPAKKSTPRTPKVEKPVGVVTHFYNHIKVAIVKFNKAVRVGATLRYQGATTDFTDTVKSMQLNHEAIKTAKKNKQIGIKVKKQVRQGDKVYIQK